ncbi:MAG: hypothetical protein HKN70_09900 [Gammaproteobacteria bacterium]|nr:hypothetical protein [Gammaproteobacteria bacterium]
MKPFIALAFGIFALSTQASLITIDLSSGWYSYDQLGGHKNINVVINLNTLLGMPAGSPVEIDGIGWDLNIATVGASWLSEAALNFDHGSLILIPGTGVDAPGDQFFSSAGVISLVALGGANIVLSDGLLTLEFFETFDATPLEIDAILSGTLTLSTVMAPVPVPAALWMLASGLFATGLLDRTRRRAA